MTRLNITDANGKVTGLKIMLQKNEGRLTIFSTKDSLVIEGTGFTCDTHDELQELAEAVGEAYKFKHSLSQNTKSIESQLKLL